MLQGMSDQVSLSMIEVGKSSQFRNGLHDLLRLPPQVNVKI